MDTVQTSEFDYDLPEELIAQQPAVRREEARLLVVHRATRTLEHRRFFELPEFLRPGDCLIRNTARVRPARLLARRAGGGRVECLLLRPELRSGPDARSGPAPERWWCLLRPGRRLPPGATFGVDGEFTARVAEKSSTAEYLVEFALTHVDDSVAALAERLGRVPLPPYIHRATPEEDDPAAEKDRTRYQTVFADRAHTVAVAAPTAGLHFSEALLARLVAEGIEFADVVLHVGLGTFRPIETEDVAAHPIHRELIEIPAATQARLADRGTGRRIAVGTTAVRAVEHWARAVAGVDGPGPASSRPATPPTVLAHAERPAAPSPAVSPKPSEGASLHLPLLPRAAKAGEAGRASTAGRELVSGADFVSEADLFIHPPATFRVIDGLITNFHLPRSTLLCLVAAFLTPGSIDGAAWLREIYAVAMRERYRFLSYGDAMLIL